MECFHPLQPKGSLKPVEPADGLTDRLAPNGPTIGNLEVFKGQVANFARSRRAERKGIYALWK
jgi:hypothetical protein